MSEIAELIHSNHAAVMVGAGFSRNANARDPSMPPFPDWSALGEYFYKKLNGKNPDTRIMPGAVPGLAEQVEVTFGRARLDRMVRQAIPNTNYDPSELHVRLLNLPWKEVLTTNYDTLLERACSGLDASTYSTVTSQEELAYSISPRILKLHGCLSTDGRLVITTNDYLKYPRNCEVFVNFVRHIIVENTLCLLGFSGDDPNFNNWLDWLHHTLGVENAPKMYLVGKLNLSESEKKVLERRNIVPVDVSEDIDGRKASHMQALKRFVAYVNSRKPGIVTPERIDWPDERSDGNPRVGADRTSQIEERVPKWERERRSYPGWLIAPADRRGELWRYTRAWTSVVPDANDLSEDVELRYAFELLWRMEKCLVPIFDNQVRFLRAIVDRGPSSNGTDVHARNLDDHSGGRGGDGSSVGTGDVWTMWYHVAMAVMRYYRMEGLWDEWGAVHNTIDDHMGAMTGEQKAGLAWEECLYAIFRFDTEGLETAVSDWPADESLPIWEMRRASVMAEIGRLADSKEILERVCVTIRTSKHREDEAPEYWFRSLESFAMVLLKAVKLAAVWTGGDFAAAEQVNRDFFARWDELRASECDPWDELSRFESALDRPVQYTPYVSSRSAFDIGRVERTHSPMTYDREALTAFNFLFFCEQAAIPFKIPGSAIAAKSAGGAVARIARHSPLWAINTLVRAGAARDSKVTDGVLGRVSLAGWKTSFVDELVDLWLGALVASSKRSGAENALDGVLAEQVPDILSRLCCRCSARSADRMLDFVVGLYQTKGGKNYRGVRNLIRRLLACFSDDPRINLIPRLVKTPVRVDVHPISRDEYRNPFEFLELAERAPRDGISIEPEDVDRLVTDASSNDEQRKRWALRTLGTLHDGGILDKSGTTRFAEALWKHVDEDGFPKETDYMRFAILLVPRVGGHDPSEIFRRWVGTQKFPLQESKSIRLDEPSTLCQEIVGASRHITWTVEEVEYITEGLVGWWDADHEYLVRPDGKPDYLSIHAEFKTRFDNLADCLASVVQPPYRASKGDRVRDAVERVVSEISAHGMSVVRLESACLHLFPEWQESVVERIETGLVSPVEEIASDAVRSVEVLSRRLGEQDDINNGVFRRVLGVLAQMIRWRSGAALVHGVVAMREIAKMHEWVLDGDVERWVLEGLHHLADETAICPLDDPLVEAQRAGWDAAMRLLLRREAAALAATLFEQYREGGKDISEGVGLWEGICRSPEEFADIRNQWRVSMWQCGEAGAAVLGGRGLVGK